MAPDIEDAARDIVDVAFQLHVGLGPGLLESVYETIMDADLRRRGHDVVRQKRVSFTYNGLYFENGFRADLVVNGQIVIEVKSIHTLAAVHWKQVLTYLRLMNLPLGFLINFGGATIKEGLHRVANTGVRPASPLAS